MTKVFKSAAIQCKALALLKDGAKLFGGSWSGKTTLLMMAVIFLAICFPGSRHLICRFRAKNAPSPVGDLKQAEEILGREYNTIYFNKISPRSYAAVTLTRKSIPFCKRGGFLVPKQEGNIVTFKSGAG